MLAGPQMEHSHRHWQLLEVSLPLSRSLIFLWKVILKIDDDDDDDGGGGGDGEDERRRTTANHDASSSTLLQPLSAEMTYLEKKRKVILKTSTSSQMIPRVADSAPDV